MEKNRSHVSGITQKFTIEFGQKFILPFAAEQQMNQWMYEWMNEKICDIL